jgi:polyhydroxybutyrate depolymerase
VGCSAEPASTEIKPGAYDWTMEAGGRTRTYRVHIPASFTPAQKFPLVIALHGGRDNGKGMERLTGLSGLAERESFIVVYPDAVQQYKYWNDGRLKDVDDVAFISELIDELEKKVSIDSHRVYATGFSNGASMANRLGAELADKIAAIGPVAGTMGVGRAKVWRPTRPVPVVYFHGTKDPFAYYYEGGSAGTWRGAALSATAMVEWWAEKNRCEGEPKEILLPDTVDDGTRVARVSYGKCDGDAEVVFYRIDGGGHTWPGGYQWAAERVAGKTSRDISANEVMWSFFERYSLEGPGRPSAAAAPVSWPPQWYGAQKLSCQWHRRGFARDPQTWRPEQGSGYGEDSHASYFHWGYSSPLPEGTKILIEGDFPHARYMDFQVSPPVDPQHVTWRGGRGAPLIPLLDEDIDPDPGHTNPFRPGANRDAKNRHYHITFELRSGNPVELNPEAGVPPYRAPGNTRIGGYRSGRYGQYGPYIELRIYAPDKFEPYGGVELPVLRIQRPGEEPVLAPPVGDIYFRENVDSEFWVVPYRPEENPCREHGEAAKDAEQAEKRQRFVEKQLAAAVAPGTFDRRAASRKLADGSLLQLKPFGIARYVCTFSYPLKEARSRCPKLDLELFSRGPNQPPPGNDEHTNGWDMYNSYLFSFASLRPGEVLLFQAKAPETPHTLEGLPTMEASPQLRYWSLCLYIGSPAVTVANCVMDENVAVDAAGHFAIVLSAVEDRPANARPECGITWLPWRAGGEGITWRFKSTSSNVWAHAPQRVPWEKGDYALATFDANAIKSVMGEYYPFGRYMSKAQMEALGCRM